MPELDYLQPLISWRRPELVAVYDELPLWSALSGTLLLDEIPLRPHQVVLDLGCGTGFPLLELAQRLGASCRVWGVDPWAAALARLQQKSAVLGVSNAAPVEGDAARLPFAGACFDLIVSNLGINNFSAPEMALQECWRVSKPGARLALTSNLRGHMQVFYDVFAQALEATGLASRLPALQAHVDHRVTVKAMTALLQQHGYRVERVVEKNVPLRYLDGSAFLRHFFIRLGFLDGWRQVLAPGEEGPVFECLEAALNRLAEAQGELRLTVPLAYLEAVKTGETAGTL